MSTDDDPPGNLSAGREPTQLIVEPTRIGRGRRSSVPPIVIAVVLVGFVGAAIWKPWDRPDPHPIATQPAPVRPSLLPSVEPIGASFPPLPTNAQLVAATTHQPTWGVRALIVRGGGPIFTGQSNVVENWVAFPPDTAAGAPNLDAQDVAGPDDVVIAIGLTTADDALPLDIRFWRLSNDEPPQRITPVAIPGPEPVSWLWLADPSHATVRGLWPGGAYEIEALLGPTIVRHVFTIPNSAPEPIIVGPPFSDSPIATVLEGLGPGIFALANGGGSNLLGGQPAVADERAAWLGAAAGQPLVARVASLDVAGFGLMLNAGEEPATAVVQQVAQRTSPIAVDVNAYTIGPANRRAIVARPRDSPLFLDGLYRVTIGWTVGADLRSGDWSIEVGPSFPVSPPFSPLDAMSRWVGFLDRPDVVTGEPLVFIGDPSVSSADCSPVTTLTGHDQLLGIVVPPKVEVVRMRMLPIGPTRSADVPIRIAPNAIPRLTVVALPPAGLAVRDYDLVLTLDSAAGQTRIVQRVCVTGP